MSATKRTFIVSFVAEMIHSPSKSQSRCGTNVGPPSQGMMPVFGSSGASFSQLLGLRNTFSVNVSSAGPAPAGHGITIGVRLACICCQLFDRVGLVGADEVQAPANDPVGCQ